MPNAGPKATAKRRKPAAGTLATSAGPEPPRKKNLRLHQSKIDAARKLLGTSTETETIEAALDLIVFRDELIQGVRSMRGAGLVNVFGDD
jgi:hypothetical protein